MTNNKKLNKIPVPCPTGRRGPAGGSNGVKKILCVVAGVALLLLAGSGSNLFPEEFPKNDNLGITYHYLNPDDSFDRLFRIGFRYNYFTPQLNVKSDSLQSYYTAKYTSIPSASYVASNTGLESDKTRISDFGLDFKFSPSPSWQLVFSYETFNDMKAAISGAGTFTTLNNSFSDADVVTVDNIQLITLGVNYSFDISTRGRYHLSVDHSVGATIYNFIQEPSVPVMLNLGLGLQQITYKATDEWTGIERNTSTQAITKVITNSFTDSISEIKPACWVGLDIYPADRFSITILGRYLDLSSQAKWGGNNADITLKGFSFGLGARMDF